MPNNKDLPAYPINYGKSHDGTLYNSFDEGYGGLTKREKIAAMCLQGLLSNPNIVYIKNGLIISNNKLQEAAFQQTDILLNNLSTTDK